jgi:serine/threonine protein kinase
MTPERWQRVSDIFGAALDRPPHERAAYLDEACVGDTKLRAEVETLLASDGSATGPNLGEPIALNVKAQIGSGSLADPLIGRRLGPFEIAKLIGRGGMGNVYLATRVSDFRQRVAIKLLKRGMDTDEILRRFRTEIRVLAALGKHPNIAALLDAGTSDDGLPYFVMEYVEGERIDVFCDRNKLTTRERVQLFRAVCSAVHFAHQHTVIHRDLKPGNILVTVEGAAKLIDFGIAKLTRPELGAETLAVTRTEARVLTPQYASPEQARGEAVTTASDVYSLGVVLYELLSGHPPYRIEGQLASRIERIVCEQEPEKPSRVIDRRETVHRPDGWVAEVSPETVSRVRDGAPQQLRRQLAGDLDNIVLKSLRKEPQRRYASAEQLSADLARYVDGSPVEARPLSRREQLGRWCRRHPLPAGLLVAVVLGSVFGLWYLARLSEQLVRQSALESAAQQSEMLQEVQNFYSDVIVERVRGKVPIDHRYRTEAGAIPVPATFTIDLGEHISDKSRSGMRARLYSDEPFTSRTGGGPRDGFETDALGELKANPKQPFYRFEVADGRSVLRYATARTMLRSCVDCHNNHPESPRHDWQVGEVRGVLSITRPLDRDQENVRRGLRDAWIVLAAVAASLLCFSALTLALGQRRAAGMR